MARSHTFSNTGTNTSTSNRTEAVTVPAARAPEAFPSSILRGGSTTAAAGQFVLVDVSKAAATVMLPAAPDDQSTVTVKLVTSGYASPTTSTLHAVTVQCGHPDTIDEKNASVQLSIWGQALTLLYEAARRTWVTVSDDMTSSQLDGRYERVVSVKAAPFNAKGDGEANDTKAIQAAINYATSINAVTFFPSSGEACYRVSQLVLPPGAILEGVSSGSYGANEGTGAVSTLTRFHDTNSHLLSIPDGNNYCRIRDIQIDGNSLHNTSGDGIHISSATDGQEGQVIIDRCYVHDNPGHNIYLGHYRRANKVLNSVCTYAGKDGICVAGSDNTVAHNICGDNARAGINLGIMAALRWGPDPDPDEANDGYSATVTHVIGNDVYKNLVGINVSSGSWGSVISSNGIDRNIKEGVAVYDGDVPATIHANVFHSNSNTDDPNLPHVEGAFPHIGLGEHVGTVDIAANIFGPRDVDVITKATYGVDAASSLTNLYGDLGIIDTQSKLPSTSNGLVHGGTRR